MKAPTLTIGSRLCACGACGQFFASPTAFDAHRSGGACLTQAALRQAGWRKNKRGFWTLPRNQRGSDADDSETG